jgi:NAD-dependent dihydropyrimidine dehydrogenase PreA subunit
MLIWWRPLLLPALALIWGVSVGTFMAFPWLSTKLAATNLALTPGREGFRWARLVPIFNPGFLPSLIVFAAFLVALAAYIWLVPSQEWISLLWWGLAGLAVSAVMSFELAGSTPIYKSGTHEERLLTVQLLEDLCTGKAMCEQVCPKNCFEVDTKRHKAVIVAGDECVQCGACIVQCPEDALVFTFPDGAIVPPEEVRRYKLNLLGERKKVA